MAMQPAPANSGDWSLHAAVLSSAMGLGGSLGLYSIRDALFQSWDVARYLPYVRLVTAVLVVFAGIAAARILTRVRPAAFLIRAFPASAALLLVAWGTLFSSERTAALVMYLHMVGFHMVLAAAFWSAVSERYDARKARRVLSVIASGGTVGGLAAAGLVWLVRQPAVLLPTFAAMHVACAFLVREMMRGSAPVSAGPGAAARQPVSLRTVPARGYLAGVASLVVLAGFTGFLLNYGLQVQVKASVSAGGTVAAAGFFALLNLAYGGATFLMQVLATRPALKVLGLPGSLACLHGGILAASAGAWFLPALGLFALIRGVDAMFRHSVFRSAYEILYTPIPLRERASAKSAIEVCADSVGDFLGAAVLILLPLFRHTENARFVLLLAVAATLAGLVITRFVGRRYLKELELNLATRSHEMEAPDISDGTTRMLFERRREKERQSSGGIPVDAHEAIAALFPDLAESGGDLPPAARVKEALGTLKAVRPADVAHLIALLGWDETTRETAEILRPVVPRHVGQLTDALADSGRPPAPRRRIARLLGACDGVRAAEGLLLGLSDPRFELREQCGRALASWATRNAAAPVEPARVYQAVLREIDSDAGLWASQRELSAGAAGETMEVVRLRSSRGLRHVFTLLSIVLPREPMLISAAAIESGDANLRGTVLEYLEGVLPAQVREKLWPHIENDRKPQAPLRPREEVLADLLRAHETLRVEMERRDVSNRRGRPGTAP